MHTIDSNTPKRPAAPSSSTKGPALAPCEVESRGLMWVNRVSWVPPRRVKCRHLPPITDPKLNPSHLRSAASKHISRQHLCCVCGAKGHRLATADHCNTLMPRPCRWLGDRVRCHSKMQHALLKLPHYPARHLKPPGGHITHPSASEHQLAAASPSQP